MGNTGIQGSKVVWVTEPAAIVDDAAFTTTEVDTAGWDHATYIVRVGATDVDMVALAVTESDSSGSGHGNVTGAVFGTSLTIAGATSTIPTATDDNETRIVDIDLRGRKRYLDLTATAGNGTTGTYMTALCILTAGDEEKQDAASRGAAEILSV